MSELIFWLIVAGTLGSAAFVVLSRQLLYSAVALLLTFFGIAGLYVFLWADFLAVIQVVIYVGGILVLIIFGIMLTHRITSVHISHTSLQRGLGGLLSGLVVVLLGFMIFKSPWLQQPAQEPAQTTATLGKLLMIDYLLPFEVASLLLLAALIGAAMLSRKEP